MLTSHFKPTAFYYVQDVEYSLQSWQKNKKKTSVYILDVSSIHSLWNGDAKQEPKIVSSH